MRGWVALWFTIACGLLIGCALHRDASTLGAGNGEIRLNTGGPVLTGVGPPLPLPNFILGGRYGVADDFDLDGELNLLAPAFGNLSLTLGGVYQWVRQQGVYAVGSGARATVLLDVDDGGRAPHALVSLSLAGERWLDDSFVLFASAEGVLSPAPPAGKPLIFVPLSLGIEWMFDHDDDGDQQGLALALGWISPWEDSVSVVEYQPRGAGAFTVHLGYRLLLGGAR